PFKRLDTPRIFFFGRERRRISGDAKSCQGCSETGTKSLRSGQQDLSDLQLLVHLRCREGCFLVFVKPLCEGKLRGNIARIWKAAFGQFRLHWRKLPSQVEILPDGLTLLHIEFGRFKSTRRSFLRVGKSTQTEQCHD